NFLMTYPLEIRLHTNRCLQTSFQGGFGGILVRLGIDSLTSTILDCAFQQPNSLRVQTALAILSPLRLLCLG
ncbi:hypothetical protein, partial [Paenibacillus foliorum]|uniref:hypothetical protein n=1 Tax=Paenibacillus foliorum TaxID=2654974 RepID=UPI001C12642A